MNPSSPYTGHGGDDLSISELSLSDRTVIFQQPFSLLAASQPEPSTPTHDDEGGDNLDADAEEEGSNSGAENAEQEKRRTAKLREEKLQSDIFILKKLNASFALFNEALQDTGSANQRVAEQLEQTDALLNKYIATLSKSEDFARLIFDEQWQGAEADEDTIERERVAKEERLRREIEERALAVQREEERRHQEEQERLEQEEKERIEREKKERMAARGGVRGVRGTRASTRGTRVVTRTAPVGTAAGSRPGSTNRTSSGGPSKLPAASGNRSSTVGSTRGLSRRT